MNKKEKIEELEQELAKLKKEVTLSESQDALTERKSTAKFGWGKIFLILIVFLIVTIALVSLDQGNSNVPINVPNISVYEKPKLSEEKIKEIANYQWNDTLLDNYSDQTISAIENSDESKSDYYSAKFSEELSKVSRKLRDRHGSDNAKKIEKYMIDNYFLK